MKLATAIGFDVPLQFAHGPGGGNEKRYGQAHSHKGTSAWTLALGGAQPRTRYLCPLSQGVRAKAEFLLHRQRGQQAPVLRRVEKSKRGHFSPSALVAVSRSRPVLVASAFLSFLSPFERDPIPGSPFAICDRFYCPGRWIEQPARSTGPATLLMTELLPDLESATTSLGCLFFFYHQQVDLHMGVKKIC